MDAMPSVCVEAGAGRGASDNLGMQHAYFAFVLHSAAPVEALQRLNERTALLTRLEGATPDLPGTGRALELRYVVWPASAQTDWHERVECTLLGRVSAWGCTRSQLRDRAKAYAANLASVLAHVLSGYAFQPITDQKRLASVRMPFAVADTGEVRRRTPASAGERLLPLPFLGLPDAEAVVDMMARQAAPTMLAICVEPTVVKTDGPRTSEGDAAQTEPDAAVGAVRRREAPGNLWSVEALTRVYDDVTDKQRQVRRLVALEQRAFRLRVQLASADAIGDALVATLIGEVGGPGRHTAQAAWQEPTQLTAGGAEWARPRSARTRRDARTEADVALENLRTLGFAPWGVGATQGMGCGGLFLADLGEAARLFALPGPAPWLPGRGHALSLPFLGGAGEGLRLGLNPVRGLARPVVLPSGSRAQHLWVLGKTGTGKSTLLESMILQDVEAGRGVIVIDPHGDLIQEILGKIPAKRAKDVIVFDPADTDFPVGINPLEASTEAEKALVVSSFLGLLKKLYDPHEQGIVGPRFEHGVRNGMLTVMSRPGGTLVEFVRVLTDDRYRNSLLPHVTDPVVRRYWTDQIAHTNDYHRSEVLDYTVSKFGRWVTDPTIRRIVGQSKSSFSFREAMDTGKIVLLSLAKGLVGGDDANFLGLILLPKILQAALSRVALPDRERRDVSLYIDEFQNYATDALALMLAEARKYHVSLVLANQHIEQLSPDIRNAVIGNVGSVVAFRLGLKDALAMEEILAPSPVTAQHLTTLPNFNAYARLLVHGQPSPTFTLATERVARNWNEARATRTRALSRKAYGRPRQDVDAEMNQRAQLETVDQAQAKVFDLSAMIR